MSSAVFHRDGRFGNGWQAVSFVVGALTLASGPVIQAGVVEGANGVLQRAGMWPALAWMTAVSTRLVALASSAGVGEVPGGSR